MAGHATSAMPTVPGCRSRVAAATLLMTVVSFPVLAQEAPAPVTPQAPSLFSEPAPITAATDFVNRFLESDSGNAKEGFYPKVGKMIAGAGWLSVGPGYRERFLNGRAVFDTFAQVSWRGYVRADASLEFPLLLNGKLAVGTETLWQDSKQVSYFGLGPDSREDLRSQYRLETTNVVGYARYRPEHWLALSGSFGWLDGPSVSSATGAFKRDYLDAQTTFPNDPAMIVTKAPQFLHAEVAITTDTRDHPGHPTRGSVYRAAAAAYSDRTLDAYSFRRYEIEGEQFIPLLSDRWIIALHAWGVASDTSAGHAVPFYMTPGLGGSNTLRGYASYRFHDRHLLLATVESRWPLFEHMDLAMFVDSGTVAARVRDLGFDKTGYGVGLRVHSHTSTTARFDVAHGGEGWRFMLRLNDPFRLSRLARWTAAIPFIP
ncbi:MAG TPA: BamA/TamA family outer membrane protein [Vicinamibacterales bacterium]|nr:BamA/TamA family outer membrane protein [Vicinamibacterales bacterium]